MSEIDDSILLHNINTEGQLCLSVSAGSGAWSSRCALLFLCTLTYYLVYLACFPIVDIDYKVDLFASKYEKKIKKMICINY